VAIIEDQRDIRECLTFLINGTEGFSCSGSYRSMEEALDRISHALPDLVLADSGLPGMNGIDGVRILKERHPDLLILMSTVYDDDVARIRRNMRWRLRLFVEKDAAG
jgi:DNA-binding NarL/FixJ family response regulator